ncbi:MAG: hypothetical protein AAB478_01695 [Patescibacteria group bacterium]
MTKEKLYALLKLIWPTVYRIINGGVYFLINLVKTIVKMSIEQIKGTF